MDYVDDNARDNDSLKANKPTKAWSQGVQRHTGCVERHLQPLWKSGRAPQRREPLSQPFKVE